MVYLILLAFAFVFAIWRAFNLPTLGGVHSGWLAVALFVAAHFFR